MTFACVIVTAAGHCRKMSTESWDSADLVGRDCIPARFLPLREATLARLATRCGDDDGVDDRACSEATSPFCARGRRSTGTVSLRIRADAPQHVTPDGGFGGELTFSSVMARLQFPQPRRGFPLGNAPVENDTSGNDRIPTCCRNPRASEGEAQEQRRLRAPIVGNSRGPRATPPCSVAASSRKSQSGTRGRIGAVGSPVDLRTPIPSRPRRVRDGKFRPATGASVRRSMTRTDHGVRPEARARRTRSLDDRLTDGTDGRPSCAGARREMAGSRARDRGARRG